jgi:capsular polysaccharide export protein
MIVYPAVFDARKAIFACLAAAEGSALPLRAIPISLRDWPETAERVEIALARAKRQPKGAVMRWLKRQLIRGQYNWSRHHFSQHRDHIALAWNGLTGSRMVFMQGAKDAGAPTLYAELAPLPGHITLDPKGVNAEGSVPQDPAFYRAYGADTDTSGWRQIGEGLTARASRRADVGQSVGTLPDAPFLFCPLQVPDDSQVKLFSGWCGGMAGFLSALQQAARLLPEGWHLRLKEHPSAKQSLGPLIEPLLAEGRVVLDNATDSFAQVAAARGVVTLNSSMGLQAFFYDKAVITLGRAFFNLPGLVNHADSQAALNALFADPDRLDYDAPLRAAFLTWLDREYYTRFDWSSGTADTATIKARLAAARGRI